MKQQQKNKKKKRPRSKLKGGYLQQKTKTNKQTKKKNTNRHSNHSSKIRSVEVFDITNKFPESLGTSRNRGSTVLRTIRTVR